MPPDSAATPHADKLSLGLALRVFIPYACGYFLSYVFRSVNSIIAPNLAGDLSLSAAELGWLTSVFFLAFALVQLPLGMLLDRYGPRRMEAALLVIAGLGAGLFAAAESLPALAWGRALIGAGMAACLMAGFAAFVDVFPMQRLPLVNGALLAVGALGAIAATLPVELALPAIGWRGVFWGLAGAGLATALLVALMAPEPREHEPHPGWGAQWAGLWRIFRSRPFWVVAPAATLTQAVFLAVQGLWAGPWLRDVGGLDRDGIAWSLGAMAVAIVASYLVTGLGADWLRRHNVRPLTIANWGMAGFVLVQGLLVAAPREWGVALWIAFGALGATSSLCYAVLSQAFPRALAGRVNTGLNLLVFVAAFLIQWGLGEILARWEDTLTHRYAPAGYDLALGIAAVLQALALAWLLGFARKQEI